MITSIFIFLILFILVGICPYLVSRRMYLNLKKKENKNALIISIVVFIVSFAIIAFVLIFVLDHVLYFGR